MYTLIPFRYLLLGYGLITACILLLSASFPLNDGVSYFAEFYKAATYAFLFIYIIGETPIFPYLCRIPFANKIIPYLEGEWIVTFQSNWPEIAKRLSPPLTVPQSSTKIGKIQIKQRLFSIIMTLDMNDGYTKSHTIFVKPRRRTSSGRLQLHYIYEAQTLVPVETDSAAHNGAASLEIKSDINSIWLEGVYWTDRNWTKGLNTAGHIVARRP